MQAMCMCAMSAGVTAWQLTVCNHHLCLALYFGTPGEATWGVALRAVLPLAVYLTKLVSTKPA